MANKTICALTYGDTHVFTLPYGVCSTAAATAAKTVNVQDSKFSLETGARVAIKFTVTNTATNPTLNVSGTGAKNIMYRGSAISAGYLAANRIYEFVYDGTNWEKIGDVNTNTTSLGSMSGTLPVSKGGTGATAADGARTNLGITTEFLNNAHNHDNGSLNPASIELKGASSHGGYIDFHYGGSSADYTSRIIESSSGIVTLNGSPILTEASTAFNNLKTSVSEGKALIAAAVTNKGVSTAADASFSTIASNINLIETFNVNGTTVNATVASGYSISKNQWVSMNSTGGETAGTRNKYLYFSHALLGLSGNRFLEIYGYKSSSGYAATTRARVWQVTGTSVALQGTAVDIITRSENIVGIIRLQNSDDFIITHYCSSSGYTGLYTIKISVAADGTITKTQILKTSHDVGNSYGGGVCRIPGTNEYLFYLEQGYSGDGYNRVLARYNNTTKIFSVSPSTTYLKNATSVKGIAYFSGYVYLFTTDTCLKYNATSGSYISSFSIQSGASRVFDCEDGSAIELIINGTSLTWYKYTLSSGTLTKSGSLTLPFDEGSIEYSREYIDDSMYISISSETGNCCLLKISSNGVGVFQKYLNYGSSDTPSNCGIMDNMIMTSHYHYTSSYYYPYYFIYNMGVLPYTGSDLYGISLSSGSGGSTIQVLTP